MDPPILSTRTALPVSQSPNYLFYFVKTVMLLALAIGMLLALAIGMLLALAISIFLMLNFPPKMNKCRFFERCLKAFN